MTDETDNLVLEHLRHIRGMLGDVQTTLGEHGRRLTSLERGQADLKRLLAHEADHAADQSARIDRLAERMDRIERRLELSD